MRYFRLYDTIRYITYKFDKNANKYVEKEEIETHIIVSIKDLDGILEAGEQNVINNNIIQNYSADNAVYKICPNGQIVQGTIIENVDRQEYLKFRKEYETAKENRWIKDDSYFLVY